MRQLSKVIWHEGMALTQHHFQAQARYFDASIHFALSGLFFEPYGVTSIQMDQGALHGGVISLRRAVGLMPDGLAFDMPDQDPVPSPRPIAEAFSTARDDHLVMLAVPPHREDGPNVDASEGDGDGEHPLAARYSPVSMRVPDEALGRDARPVSVGRKNFRLLLDHEAESQDLVILPIARVRRASGGRFAYDLDYVPPCLQIGASERLVTTLGSLIEILEGRRATLSGEQADSRVAVAYGSHEITTFWLLHAISAALPGLSHLGRMLQEHPERLYSELVRLAGALCTFSHTSHPLDLPAYAHDDLGPCVEMLARHVREHLDLVVPTSCLRVGLQPSSEYLFTGDITDRRAFAPSTWILGVRSHRGGAELAQRLPKLAKVCSRAWVDRLIEQGLPGMALQYLPSPPPAVTPRADTRYFELTLGGPCGGHVRKTGTIGVYLPGELGVTDVELAIVMDE